METGTRVSKYPDEGSEDVKDYFPVEFVTLKDGSEGLVIYHENIINVNENEIKNESSYKFIDPFHPSDAIDITDIYIKNRKTINNYRKVFITKSNRKFSIIDNNVCVTDGLKEDTFQQMLSTTYHSNIYTLPIFKTIRNMLEDIINNNVCFDIPKGNEIQLTNGKLFRFNLDVRYGSAGLFKILGLKKSQDVWEETFSLYRGILSYKQLNNEDLALITKEGIFIYTIDEVGKMDELSKKMKPSLTLRYFWNNKKWYDNYKRIDQQDNINDDYKTVIRNILSNEFKDSLSSLPSPNFINMFEESKPEYKELVLRIINDPVEFSKFGLKMLEIAIDKKNDSVVNQIFDKIEVESTTNMLLLSFISLNLHRLCHHYSKLVMKYILNTSIMLDPFLSKTTSKNSSLYAYSRSIYIKKSFLFKSLMVSFYKKLIRKRPQETTICFITPFPKICKYYDTKHNPWNEMLHKPESILFCNIDTKRFYKWWNFASIIDFKWNYFGMFYYYLIWFFYTIFFICFALASTLDHNLITDYNRDALSIISILLGILHLSFEFRQFLWNPKCYINDKWNLLEVLAYSLPVITSTYWLILGKPPLGIIAISNLLLNFKFILFFRVFHTYEKYFIIITNVISIVYPFIIFLFFIIFGFAHAFFILLKSEDSSTSLNLDGTTPKLIHNLISNNDSNTNMFNWFGTSLLAIYLLLTGDSGSLSSWSYNEAPTMTFLLVLFTFFTVIYLMNLFIGLLNMEIEDYHNKCEIFLLQKAKVIAEIELFYMLPCHRYKEEWFPDWIYYNIPVNDVRQFINAIDNNKTRLSSPPFISDKLRKLVELEISKPVDSNHSIDEIKHEAKDLKIFISDELKKLVESELKKETKDLKKQMNDIQELLKRFIDKNDSQHQ